MNTNRDSTPLAEAEPGTSLLDHLRNVELRLYRQSVVAKVAELPEDDRHDFVNERLKLSQTIAHLHANELRTLRCGGEELTADLERGIASLQRSLGSLDRALSWAKAIHRVTDAACAATPLI